MHHKIIYMTGAPGVGKTTLLNALLSSGSKIKSFHYGTEMRAHLNARASDTMTSQELLRSKVRSIVDRSDISQVNQTMMQWIVANRKSAHLIIDSHQVTYDPAGLTCVPFSRSELHNVNLDEIWVLVAPAETVAARLRERPDGRAIPSKFMIEQHILTQMAVATSYAVNLGCTLRILDSSEPTQNMLRFASEFLQVY